MIYLSVGFVLLAPLWLVLRVLCGPKDFRPTVKPEERSEILRSAHRAARNRNDYWADGQNGGLR